MSELRNYKSKYFTVKIDTDGIINFSSKEENYNYTNNLIHADLGCRVANELVSTGIIEHCSSTEWYNACLIVMDSIVEISERMKYDVLKNINFYIHPKYLEEIHGKGETKHYSFKEANAYIHGYSDAVIKFREVFKYVEESISDEFDKVFPKLEEISKN